MQTSVGKNILVVTEKYEFERQDKSYIVKIFLDRFDYWH